MEEKEQNWDRFKDLLFSTEREGMHNLIEYLEKNGIKNDPASAKYHSNYVGGLIKHSLNVYNYASRVNKSLNISLPSDHIIIASLLHDICKVKYYILGEEWDKEWKEKTNQWRKKTVWKVEEELPIGHGEKSVILAARFIELTPEEMTAIRWHMGAWDPGLHFFYPSGSPFRAASEKYPLVKVIMIADQMAELYETIHEKKEDPFEGRS